VKVGDIVRQNGKLVECPGEPAIVARSRVPKVLGVVVEIDERRKWPKRFSKWQNFLGRSVTVMWANDRMMSVAENALDVVDESR
jgi:hypothetical protein